MPNQLRRYSQVTDAVGDEIRVWQARPLESVPPMVYSDVLVTRSRWQGAVSTRHVYVAVGVNLEGEKELLGPWLAQTKGAKFWLNILTTRKNRGVQDILIAGMDGLKGFTIPMAQRCSRTIARSTFRLENPCDTARFTVPITPAGCAPRCSAPTMASYPPRVCC